ncbi:fas-binding factor 1-like [Scleropages formosus]|uniref:Fas-binding factor 1-like n=1 Tax=Scleropages formosus TaxID=113540 RepID=A0A0P7XPL6_SCLFO|nr:fas-binding factor 1-like [Scleropages formosus]
MAKRQEAGTSQSERNRKTFNQEVTQRWGELKTEGKKKEVDETERGREREREKSLKAVGMDSLEDTSTCDTEGPAGGLSMENEAEGDREVEPLSDSAKGMIQDTWATVYRNSEDVGVSILSGSIDDVLGDLLGDDDPPVRTRSPVRIHGQGGTLTSRSGKRSLLDDDFFSKLAEEAGQEEDMDDMDADLFGSKKKPSSAPPQTTVKAPEVGHKSGDESKAGETENPESEVKKPSSAPTPATRGYKKFTFNDRGNSLSDLLDDSRTTEVPKDSIPEDKGLPPSESPAKKREETASPTRAPKKREELTFDDDEDDLMDALGFGESPKGKGVQKKESNPPRPARTRLDEILGRGTSPHLLERPPTGEKKEVQPEKSVSTKDVIDGEDDITFGSYQPTITLTPEGRQSRRQSVRFSTEEDCQSLERKPKTASPSTKRTSKPPTDWSGLKQDSQSVQPKPKQASPSGARPNKPAADWLGLMQDEEEVDYEQPVSAHDGQVPVLSLAPSQADKQSAPSSQATPGGPPRTQSVNTKPSSPQVTPSWPRPESSTSRESEDWLSEALTRKKTLSVSKTEERAAPHEVPQGLGQEVDIEAFLRPPVNKALQLVIRAQKKRTDQPLLAQSQLWGLGGALQRKDAEQQSNEHALQARIIQLEGQVRSLQLERDQMQVLLESIQQRHRQDTELMETTHRARVKLLEESSAQREARARQDSEDLAERLASVTRLAEQERAELQAQYQRRLAQSQEDRDREVERLRDLQRKSILEMKKDHEEQVQRLKRLKDEEIDAVTSATSQTRSLTVVIEQMELFSRRLGELSSRVESTHEHTAQGLELSARQREEQLRAQQNAMAAERARLKEVIAKMDIQLAEQQRQLEKERWRVTAEQAKAESAQRALDEERRTLTQHIAMEREELERAKRCAEERRKLSAEWAQLHAQEKLRQERAEREASRALERDAHREGSLISMVQGLVHKATSSALPQEQADLKLRAAELRLREEAVAKEKAELEHQRAELEREKEALSAAALRLKARAQEVEAFSKLASERYEEGERALQEARQVEAEHHTRLRNIHTQMERLRQQEQHLHQERIRLTEHRREADRLRPRIPINPQLPTTSVLSDFAPVAASTQLPPPTASPLPTLPGPQLGSPELQARLALLRYVAEKDRDFLQDEQLFLETLKKAPYNSAFHTA